jgi:hypothetical protein
MREIVDGVSTVAELARPPVDVARPRTVEVDAAEAAVNLGASIGIIHRELCALVGAAGLRVALPILGPAHRGGNHRSPGIDAYRSGRSAI